MRFSNWLASAILMWMAGTTWAQYENLFFSEAAEGSSNNKYLEIYNPTDADVDWIATHSPVCQTHPRSQVNTSSGTTLMQVPQSLQVTCTSLLMDQRIQPSLLKLTTPSRSCQTATTASFLFKVMGVFIQLDAVGDWNGDPGSG